MKYRFNHLFVTFADERDGSPPVVTVVTTTFLSPFEIELALQRFSELELQ